MNKVSKKKNQKEPTLAELRADVHDVFEAVGSLAGLTHTRFEAVGKRFDAVDKRLDTVEEDVAFLRRNMINKIYLDERIGDLRGDITELVHREDRKFIELVHILESKEILSEEETVHILSMPPFPLGQG